jgi:hypothetical protein
MKSKVLSLAILPLLAIASCLADDQALYIARLRANPTEDFSHQGDNILSLADADAMIYFQDHKAKLNLPEEMEIGRAHAVMHRLQHSGYDSTYALRFAVTLDVLLTDN